MKYDLVILLVNYYRQRLTEYCINSIAKTLENSKTNYALIVIDNNSPDKSQEMIKDFNEKGIITEFLFNPKNFGEVFALNQGLEIIKKKYSANFFLWIVQDFFCMDGWYENALTVINDLGLSYVSCTYYYSITSEKYIHTPEQVTVNGGKYGVFQPRKKYDWDTGHAPFIKFEEILKLDRFPVYIHKCPQMSFYHYLQSNIKLKGVKLYKPTILLQDPESLNPEYIPYYKFISGKNGVMSRMKMLRRHQKKGNVLDPVEYYKGSNYKLSKYFSAGGEKIPIPVDLWRYDLYPDKEYNWE